jgi:hypothetical protein
MKNRTTIDAAIPLLVTYPKDIKSLSHRVVCTPRLSSALFTTVKV